VPPLLLLCARVSLLDLSMLKLLSPLFRRQGPEGYAPNPESNRATNFGLFMKHTAIPDELRKHGRAMALAWFSKEWAKLSDEDKEVSLRSNVGPFGSIADPLLSSQAWKARAEDGDCMKRLEEAKIGTFRSEPRPTRHPTSLTSKLIEQRSLFGGGLAELVARMPTRPGRLHGPTLFHRTQECKDLVKSWADEARAAGRKPVCTVNLYAKAWSSLSMERQEVRLLHLTSESVTSRRPLLICDRLDARCSMPAPARSRSTSTKRSRPSGSR
jgi:predicted GNAT family acetyltransferase